MWGEIVPLSRCHAVQIEVSVVEDRTGEWTTLVFMYIGSDKGCLGRPYESGDDPGDAVRAVLAAREGCCVPTRSVPTCLR